MSELISIKERLPESGENVLVWFSGKPELEHEPRFGTAAFFEHSGRFSGEKYFGRVSHWMPLPEPPEVDK